MSPPPVEGREGFPSLSRRDADRRPLRATGHRKPVAVVSGFELGSAVPRTDPTPATARSPHRSTDLRLSTPLLVKRFGDFTAERDRSRRRPASRSAFSRADAPAHPDHSGWGLRLLQPYGGHCCGFLGLDPRFSGVAIRAKLGVCSTSGHSRHPELTWRQNLMTYARIRRH